MSTATASSTPSSSQSDSNHVHTDGLSASITQQSADMPQPTNASTADKPTPSSNHFANHPDYAKEPSPPPTSSGKQQPPSSSSDAAPASAPATAAPNAADPLQQSAVELAEIDKEQAEWRQRCREATLRFAALHWRSRAVLTPSSTAASLAGLSAALTGLSSTLIHLDSEAAQLSSLYSSLQQKVNAAASSDSARRSELLAGLRARSQRLRRDQLNLAAMRGRVTRAHDALTHRSAHEEGGSTASGEHKTSIEIEDVTAEEEEKERSTLDSTKASAYTREDISASLHVASEHKARGNAQFHANNFTSAFDDYRQALAAIHHLTYPAVAAQFPDLAEQLKLLLVSTHSNMAACKLLAKQFDDVVLHTNLVLQLDPNNVKGLVRRGKAYAAKSESALALIDLLRARELMKDDEKGRREIEPFIHELQRRAYEQVERERREKDREKNERREREREKERERERAQQQRFAQAYQQALKQQAVEEEEEKRMDREDEERDRRAREVKEARVRFSDAKAAPEPRRTTESPKVGPASSTSTTSKPSSSGSSSRVVPVSSAASASTPAPLPVGRRTSGSGTASAGGAAGAAEQSEREAVNSLLSQLFGMPVSTSTSRASPHGQSQNASQSDRQLQQAATLERQVSEAKVREQERGKQRMAALEAEIKRERERQAKLRAHLQQQQRQEQQQAQQQQSAAATAAHQHVQQHLQQTHAQPHAASSHQLSAQRPNPYVEFPDEDGDVVLDTSHHGRGRAQQLQQHSSRDDADDIIDSIFSHLLGVPVTTQRQSPPTSGGSHVPLSRTVPPGPVQITSVPSSRTQPPRRSPSPPLLYEEQRIAPALHHWQDAGDFAPYGTFSEGVALHRMERPSEREPPSHPHHPFGPGSAMLDEQMGARGSRPHSATAHHIPITPYSSQPPSPPASLPVDIFDRPSSYHIHAHLPGVHPSDVSLSFTSPCTLRITARRREPFDEHGEQTRLVRDVHVPEDVDPEGMEARLEHGMLRIAMRKTDSRRERGRSGGREARAGRVDDDSEHEWRESREHIHRERERTRERQYHQPRAAYGRGRVRRLSRLYRSHGRERRVCAHQRRVRPVRLALTLVAVVHGQEEERAI